MFLKTIIILKLLVFSTASLAEPDDYITPTKLEIFYSNEHRIIDADNVGLFNIKVTKYNFDTQINLEKELNNKILVNGKKAHKLSNQTEIDEAVKQVKMEIKKLKLAGRFDGIFSAVVLAKQYGLTRYPAIVINSGEEIMYGITDVNRALLLHKEIWLQNNLGEEYEKAKNGKI